MNNGPIERALARALSNRQTAQTSLESITDEPNTSISTPSSPVAQTRRRKVHVNTLAQSYSGTTWMVDHATSNGSKHIASKYVRQFPQYFAGNTKANLEKAALAEIVN